MKHAACLAEIAIAIAIFMLAVSGCANTDSSENSYETAMLQFKNTLYNFSFSYPNGWDETTRDLPQKWAIVDKNKDTILFIVDKAKSDSVITLGMLQALRDIYPNGNSEENISGLGADKLKDVAEMVNLHELNGTLWYAYGMKFHEKNIDSLVSGTLCNGNEVTFVLVSNSLTLEKNREIYTKMLASFECS